MAEKARWRSVWHRQHGLASAHHGAFVLHSSYLPSWARCVRTEGWTAAVGGLESGINGADTGARFGAARLSAPQGRPRPRSSDEGPDIPERLLALAPAYQQYDALPCPCSQQVLWNRGAPSAAARLCTTSKCKWIVRRGALFSFPAAVAVISKRRFVWRAVFEICRVEINMEMFAE